MTPFPYALGGSEAKAMSDAIAMISLAGHIASRRRWPVEFHESAHLAMTIPLGFGVSRVWIGDPPADLDDAEKEGVKALSPRTWGYQGVPGAVATRIPWELPSNGMYERPNRRTVHDVHRACRHVTWAYGKRPWREMRAHMRNLVGQTLAELKKSRTQNRVIRTAGELERLGSLKPEQIAASISAADADFDRGLRWTVAAPGGPRGDLFGRRFE